ncbi:GDSL family lipase [Siphonobacter sp. BAB-5385]|uniref:SGNH/GDSL hydrolase family protein n=1 Tax=Siphonobacter sp. BAB-5385 TaxID=1864822 RepID=UPI000B9ECC98|nr:SGNH/GDSL hydrolase family protein [Siphonobacter sp. BAB-5385]OZI07405.1 GDSL family lipase [Siphonobacter sp. BAB-5385]
MKKLLCLVSILFVCGGSAPRNLSWLALGDSITYLNDHTDETQHRISKGYLTLITERHPRIHYINQGHNGWSAVQIAQKIESLGLVKADVYTVFLGTNDWWQGKALGTLTDYEQHTGAETIYGSFRIILDKFKQLNASARVILITPMQRVDFVYINNFKNQAYGSYQEKNGQRLEQVVEAINQIGKLEKYPVVDLYHDSDLALEKLVRFKRLKDPQTGQYRDYPYPDFIGVPFNPDTDEYPYPKEAAALTYDGLHPSDAGYEIIADRLLSKWRGRK